jgi:hypothetical protein
MFKTIRSLVILLIILSASILSAQDKEPRVIIRSLPEEPVAGSTWILTFLIAHNEPNEVDVLAPPFTDPLLLEQVTKMSRFINTTELWTVVEYRFKANSPGIFSFSAFTVITPGARVMIDPFEVTVLQSPAVPQTAATAQTYRLVWEGLPSRLAIGESAVFNLRISGWNSAPHQPTAFIPESGLFMPPVLPGHILESLHLSPEEKSVGTVLKLRLVPLEAYPFAIEGRRISVNTANSKEAVLLFDMPSLRIPVNRAQGLPTVTNEANDTVQEKNTAAPFPSLEAATAEHHTIYNKYTTECDATYASAKNLWESARFAESLALLRQKERDHPAGKLFAVIRREIEQALGFTGTHDERRDLIMKLWLFMGRYRCGVLMETTIRRIPDQAGEEITRFREGQPVLILQQGTKPNKWLQVISGDNNKTSGWVPEDKIIFY